MSKSIDLIVSEVSRQTGVCEYDILYGGRTKPLIQARNAAYFLARRMTGFSYPYLAEQFGKDHTTVMSGYDRCISLMLASENYKAMVRRIHAACRPHVKRRKVPSGTNPKAYKLKRPVVPAKPIPRAPKTVQPKPKPLPKRPCCVTGCDTLFHPESRYQTRCPQHRSEDMGMFEGYAA